MFAGREEKVTIEPFEIAIDALVTNVGLDAIDRGRMTLGGQAGAVFAMQPFNFNVAVVHGVRKMGRGALSLTSTYQPVIYDNHRFALTGKQVSGRQAGDAGAHDAHVRELVILK